MGTESKLKTIGSLRRQTSEAREREQGCCSSLNRRGEQGSFVFIEAKLGLGMALC